MVAIQTIRSQLSDLQKGPAAKFVAVLVGATSGIGESTAREIARYVPRPVIYLIGRAQAEAERLKSELETLNTKSQVHFIKSDVSLLREVDKVCNEIVSKEGRINVLCMSAGILTMKGRDETSEGLDRKLSLHYYSRMRFAENLLPALKAASKPAEDPAADWSIARVISVLGSGYEGPLNTSDLSLKTTYSVRAAANHATSMTSLYFDRLAKENPSVAFIHTQPGAVDTNIKRELGTFMQYAWTGAAVLIKPFMTSVQEVGERHAWTATAHEFDAGGVHNIGQTNGPNGSTKLLKKFKGDGTTDKVVQHTREVFASMPDSSST